MCLVKFDHSQLVAVVEPDGTTYCLLDSIGSLEIEPMMMKPIAINQQSP